VIDFEDVKSHGDRKAVFNLVQKLKDVGPDLPSPHMKSLKGRPDLFELRPSFCSSRKAALSSRFALNRPRRSPAVRQRSGRSIRSASSFDEGGGKMRKRPSVIL